MSRSLLRKSLRKRFVFWGLLSVIVLILVAFWQVKNFFMAGELRQRVIKLPRGYDYITDKWPEAEFILNHNPPPVTAISLPGDERTFIAATIDKVTTNYIPLRCLTDNRLYVYDLLQQRMLADIPFFTGVTNEQEALIRWGFSVEIYARGERFLVRDTANSMLVIFEDQRIIAKIPSSYTGYERWHIARDGTVWRWHSNSRLGVSGEWRYLDWRSGESKEKRLPVREFHRQMDVYDDGRLIAYTDHAGGLNLSERSTDFLKNFSDRMLSYVPGGPVRILSLLHDGKIASTISIRADSILYDRAKALNKARPAIVYDGEIAAFTHDGKYLCWSVTSSYGGLQNRRYFYKLR